MSAIAELAKHRSVCIRELSEVARSAHYYLAGDVVRAIERLDKMMAEAIVNDRQVARFVDRQHKSIWVRR